MKLFSIDNDGKLTPYLEHNFAKTKQEADLEDLLENNPEYFFERSNVLIIGRQVTTNLNTYVDLLGVDKNGNTVIIELKRGKTPRETIAQLLEYASFIENLDYAQLNEIYQGYTGEEISLEDYHQQFFQNESADQVSFNKSTKLVIVAQDISKEVRQTALFLRKKGIDVYCMEFKYFETRSKEKIISSDFVVGDEEFIRQKVHSASLPKVNEKQFLASLDKNGLAVFKKIVDYAHNNDLSIRWGSKGFSLNVDIDDAFVGLFFGYPLSSVFKQSIYARFSEINKKVKSPENIINFYKRSLQNLSYFVKTKWLINKAYSESDVQQFLNVIEEIIKKIKENGLK
jgi:hypothetical protein